MVDSITGGFLPAAISDVSSGAGSLRDEVKSPKPAVQGGVDSVSFAGALAGQTLVEQMGGRTFPTTAVDQKSLKNPGDKKSRDEDSRSEASSSEKALESGGNDDDAVVFAEPASRQGASKINAYSPRLSLSKGRIVDISA